MRRLEREEGLYVDFYPVYLNNDIRMGEVIGWEAEAMCKEYRNHWKIVVRSDISLLDAAEELYLRVLFDRLESE